jgi:hypothetical protein
MPRFLSSILSILWLSLLTVYGQNTGVSVKGKVTDSDNQPLERVNVMIKGSRLVAITNGRGEFTLPPVFKPSVYLVFSSVGYERVEREVIAAENSFILQVLKPDLQKIQEIVVEGNRDRPNIEIIQPKLTERLPAMAGGVETLIKTLPGVGSNNELSSQYSVRGGNFDENLVYVNGIEIIRPFLVKSGEQEGLKCLPYSILPIVNPNEMGPRLKLVH